LRNKKCKTVPKDCEWSQCRVLNKCSNSKTTDIFYIKLNQDNTVNISVVEEKIYSEEQVIDLLLRTESSPLYEREYMKDWIKENL